ncbi:hypothetical protein [Neorhodopirellula pilleata]|uniref:Uncharacterized protein n=1 Tax=Neorhodopirellula pilleata TaxID=2714738 RepID=A0A5C6A4B5_9BACT|nr:hypothetical protein [Neorhodopirellula pilleata]TWT94276.1 hypothetical protein Pla100_38860 [Neorhodopirellula pilleata]
MPSEFDRDITYFSMVEKRDVTVDGHAEYLRDHFWGWEECRDYFVDDISFEGQKLWNAPEENPMVPSNIIHAPGHVIDAYRDGWRQCQLQIRLKLKTISERNLREEFLVPQTLALAVLYGLGFGLGAASIVTLVWRCTGRMTEPADARESPS